MRNIVLKCDKCNTTVEDKLPSKLLNSVCQSCKEGTMRRVFSDIKCQDVVSDMMMDISQKMLYS